MKNIGFTAIPFCIGFAAAIILYKQISWKTFTGSIRTPSYYFHDQSGDYISVKGTWMYDDSKKVVATTVIECWQDLNKCYITDTVLDPDSKQLSVGNLIEKIKSWDSDSVETVPSAGKDGCYEYSYTLNRKEQKAFYTKMQRGSGTGCPGQVLPGIIYLGS